MRHVSAFYDEHLGSHHHIADEPVAERFDMRLFAGLRVQYRQLETNPSK